MSADTSNGLLFQQQQQSIMVRQRFEAKDAVILIDPQWRERTLYNYPVLLFILPHHRDAAVSKCVIWLLKQNPPSLTSIATFRQEIHYAGHSQFFLQARCRPSWAE
jgi:hypothetical protein